MRIALLLLALSLAAPAPGAAQATDPAILRRLSDYESELRRLTARVEELERRLAEAERAAEARHDDLEFRVLELEGGDPMAAFGGGESAAAEGAPAESPAAQGGEAAAASPEAAPPATSDGPGAPPRPLGELAVAPSEGERSAYEAAMRDLEALGPDAGRASVERFIAGHPDSPLAGEALRRVGRSLLSEGRAEEAAQAFFLGVRDHPGRARPENLLGLGEALAALGRTDRACGAFAEIPRSHPDALPAVLAAAERAAREAGCP